jgi:hypothetical protein
MKMQSIKQASNVQKSKKNKARKLKDEKTNSLFMYKGKLPQRIANVMLKNLAIDGEEVYIPFKIL